LTEVKNGVKQKEMLGFSFALSNTTLAFVPASTPVEHAFMERLVEVLNAYELPSLKKAATPIVQKKKKSTNSSMV
jgi:hypothetical protein